MKFIRLTEPTDAAKLIPWLVPTDEQDRMTMACLLAQRLATVPERTFCLVAVQDRIAHAILIAYISEKYRNTVWIWQARTDIGFKKGAAMLDECKRWAKENRCKQVRMALSNTRLERFYERHYGFRRKGKEMICNVA